MASNSPSRPLGLWLLTWLLALSPAFHIAALLVGLRVLNFGSQDVWDSLVLVLVAPWVARRLWICHPRARFSAYVFFSCELVRAVRIGSPGLGLVSLLALLYLQSPGAVRFHPKIQPKEVLARFRTRKRTNREAAERE